jgi:Domain of unknown function (DUF4928)
MEISVPARNDPTKEFVRWYGSLSEYSGFPAKGTIAGALVVLQHLQEDFDLDIESHTAKGGSQVRGAGGTAVRKILESFGETRSFVSEGGRTNRGLRGDINSMLEALDSSGIARLPAKTRNSILRELQQFLVDRVNDFHQLQRLEIAFDSGKSTWQTINDLIAKAAETGKDGPVAQYLVGAKLQLRFPEKKISNESYSTADMQKGRQGDFRIGDTVFHITVAPMQAVYEKCKKNLERELRVYLIVPEQLVAGTKQNAELHAAGRITVQSIESFVSQNVDELSQFSIGDVRSELRQLLELYNERVNATESNKSMMIEIPSNL